MKGGLSGVVGPHQRGHEQVRAKKRVRGKSSSLATWKRPSGRNVLEL